MAKPQSYEATYVQYAITKREISKTDAISKNLWRIYEARFIMKKRKTKKLKRLRVKLDNSTVFKYNTQQ